MKITRLFVYGSFVVICILLASGCATPNRAILVSPDLQSREIGDVHMLPVVDARKDTSVKVDLRQKIMNPICSAMKKKGYSVISECSLGADGATPSEIGEMTPAEMCRLGPSEARTLCVIIVEDIASDRNTCKVEIVGFMLDKTSEEVLWKGKGIGNQQGQGGLVGIIVGHLTTLAALETSTDRLMQSLPERTTPKR